MPRLFGARFRRLTERNDDEARVTYKSSSSLSTFSKLQSAKMVAMYTIAGRQVGSHWVFYLIRVPGKAFQQCCPGPIGRTLWAYEFENDVLTAWIQ
jgi:hypothetical protein